MGKYNILVVEDEPIVRRGISSIIASFSDKITVVEASTGIEAVDASENFPPDIVIMDIKLPEMDGIKAATIIKRKIPKVKIVILTAYSEFEYAKESVKLGAVDYILKPIDEKSLKKLITRLIEDIETEKEREANIELMKSKLSQILPYTEMKVAYDLLLNNIEDEKQIKQILEAIGIYLLPSTVFVVSIESSSNLFPKDLYNKLLLKEGIYNILKEILKGDYRAFTIPFLHFNEFVIFYSPEEIDKEELKYATLNLGEYIYKEISNRMPFISIYIGIGNTYRDISYVHKSYIEALHAISQGKIKGSKVTHIDDVKVVQEWQISYPSIERELQEYIIKRERDKAISSAKKILEEVYKNSNNNLIIVKSIMLYVMLDSFKIIAKFSKDIEKLMMLQSRYTDGLIQLNSFSDILTWTSLIIEELINLYSETNTKDEIVERAIKFINENYMNDIGLKEVAGYLFVSPYYLSHIFKELTGKTFTEYLTSIRLNRAKELLTVTNLSISDISSMVGYEDTNYFSKIFKKQIGITPSSYRSSAQAELKRDKK